jgi:hypothetical protein
VTVRPPGGDGAGEEGPPSGKRRVVGRGPAARPLVICVGCPPSDVGALTASLDVRDARDEPGLVAALLTPDPPGRAILLDCRRANGLALALLGADPGTIGTATLVLWGASRLEHRFARNRFRLARTIVLDPRATAVEIARLLAPASG